MSLKVGIVGLPNVGKSTIFNILTKKSVPADNYPFCTIDPNIGIVPVPDDRLLNIDSISHSKSIVPSVVEFVDIAGLVKGASKGEGLGNQFLAHIREVDAIVHVLRVFNDSNVIHVEGRVNAEEDLDIINTEIAIKDLEVIEKAINNEEKRLKAGDKLSSKRLEILSTIKKELESGNYNIQIDYEDLALVKYYNLLVLKPRLYVLNVSEEDLSKNFEFPFDYIKISAKLESEMISMSDEEKKEMLDLMGLKESGIDLLIKYAYKALNLISYFTEGPDEVRSWTIKEGTLAPEAAGVIHTDFEEKFIRLEVVNFIDFMEGKGWNGAKDKGLLRSEGRDYKVKDGDIVIVRHS